MISITKPFDCVVRGAGIIGLSCALEMARRGARVLLVDPVWPPRGASWAAAGMIAPAYEAAGAAGVHPELFDLCLESAKLWPEWSAQLSESTGVDAGYDGTPSIAVAVDREQSERLQTICDVLRIRGLPWSVIENSALRNVAKIGVRLPTDTQVDNRKTLAALSAACAAHALITVKQELASASRDRQLVTAGWRSNDVLPTSLPISPISGQMVSLERGAGDPEMPVRCGSIYIVPKSGRIIVGATVEPEIIRRVPEEQDIGSLIRHAARLFPEFAGRGIIESWAGVRPGTPDHAPYLGRIDEKTYVATGHHRNGILLAPLTARIMADFILDGVSHPLLDAFSPARGVALPQSESGRNSDTPVHPDSTGEYHARNS
ncbi:MAG: FAD-dependent oxidoreductase [Pseudomonadota bacterium]